MAEAAYTAKDITVLEGLEPVRKRPGMYIGSTGSRGLHHLAYEVVANSVDEALAGRCDLVEVTIHPDESMTVRDNGSGIPVDVMKDQGLPALTVVLTKLHAGGKFGQGGYKVSGGLHGVGVSVVNALSEWLIAEVQRDGGAWQERELARPEYRRGLLERFVSWLADLWDRLFTGATVGFSAFSTATAIVLLVLLLVLIGVVANRLRREPAARRDVRCCWTRRRCRRTSTGPARRPPCARGGSTTRSWKPSARSRRGPCVAASSRSGPR